VVTNRLETDPVRVAFLENAPESQDIQSTIDALTDDGYTALLIIPLSSSSYSTAVHNLAVNIGVARCAIEAHEHNASDRIQSIVPVALTTALDFNEHTAQYYLSTLAGVDCGDKECSLIFVVDAVADDELATRNERIMEQYAKLLEELDVKIETSQLVIFDKNEDRFADQMKLTLSEAKEHESTPVIINHSILFPYEMSDGIVDSLITVGYSPDNYVIVGDGLFWDYSFHLWLVSQIFEPNFLIYY
jgi:hypothetical protein